MIFIRTSDISPLKEFSVLMNYKIRQSFFPTARDVFFGALFFFLLCASGSMIASSGRVLAAEPNDQKPADPAAVEAITHANALSQAFRHAAKLATPSVVVVRSEIKSRKVSSKRVPGKNGGENRFKGNPFKGTPLEEMFPDGMPEGFDFQVPGDEQSPSRSGVGSGVIVDASGIVLTNNHVVEGADVVSIELTDGRTFTATEIKTDPDSDLAVIRFEGGKDLPIAVLGDSDSLAIGDWVIAIGTPFELETTVSAGIISGKGRELGSVRRAKFLQTDAAINPGNSGGPLVNLNGEVIGINTAIASNSGGYQGIGFAIPANLAKWVSDQLIANGSVQRGYLGVSIGPLQKDVASKLGIEGSKGALVSEIMPDSPAARAGVEELDVITMFDGKPVDGPRTLQEIVERSPQGKAHDMTVLRSGKPVTLSIVVKPLPESLARTGSGRRLAPSGTNTFYSADLGIEVSPKNTEAEDAYEGFDGVVVNRVDPEGLSAEAGIGPGMLVRKVGKTPIASVSDFEKALVAESIESGVMLQVRTPRGNQVVMLKKES